MHYKYQSSKRSVVSSFRRHVNKSKTVNKHILVGNTQNLIKITPKYTQYEDKTKMYARMANIARSGTRVPACGIQVLEIHEMGLKRKKKRSEGQELTF